MCKDQIRAAYGIVTHLHKFRVRLAVGTCWNDVERIIHGKLDNITSQEMITALRNSVTMYQLGCEHEYSYGRIYTPILN